MKLVIACLVVALALVPGCLEVFRFLDECNERSLTNGRTRDDEKGE